MVVVATGSGNTGAGTGQYSLPLKRKGWEDNHPTVGDDGGEDLGTLSGPLSGHLRSQFPRGVCVCARQTILGTHINNNTSHWP